MGLIGRKIVQSRTWLDPSAPPPPNLNYEETFPNTVLEAVYENMDVDSCKNLKQILEEIHSELGMRQMKFPAKPANYIMTFAGTAGSVGSIQMSREIPWDPGSQRHDRIPTEKAVGDFIQKLGLVDEDGNIVEPGDLRVRWSDIIGRPLIYEDIGDNVDGFMTQKAVTENITNIKNEVLNLYNEMNLNVNKTLDMVSKHINDKNNPHNITLAQIGAISIEAFNSHIEDKSNPHQVTAEQIGLGNVNNTSDLDKPVSNATQKALDSINNILNDILNDADSFMSKISYDITTGILTSIYHNGDTSTLKIPINGLVDEVSYDKDKKDLIITELSGEIKRVSLLDLFHVYQGSISENITVVIEDKMNPGATVVPFDEMVELSVPEVNDVWDHNKIPADADYDVDDPGVSQISEDGTEDMWEDGTMPDESGPEQIKRDQITEDEVQKLWFFDTPIYETPDENKYADGSMPTGWHIIKATINAKSITSNEMADNSIIPRTIRDEAITTSKIMDLAVTSIKLANESVTTEKICNYNVTNKKLADRSVNGRTLFTSLTNNRVLGVRENGTDPTWLQIIADMIDYNAIESRHILKAAVTADKIAEKAIITSKIEDSAVTTDKIADNSISNSKLKKASVDGDNLSSDIIIPGSPSITKRPDIDHEGSNIPDTYWVAQRIRNHIFTNENYGNRTVDGRVLFSSDIRHRVLTVLRANSDPVWGQIDNEMMADNSVDTHNLIDASVIGSKIKEKVIERRHLVTNIISTDYIEDGAVTSEKLFSYHTANRVLAVIKDNTHPVYSQVTRNMIENNAIGTMQIEDHSVALSKLELSDQANRILGIVFGGTNPVWTQITSGMIKEHAVLGKHIFTTPFDNMILAVPVAGQEPVWMKIRGEMLGERSIKREHIGLGEIWSEHLQEKLIESRHILDWTIQSNNIAPRAITGTELFTSPLPNRILAVTNVPYANPDWVQVNSDMIKDQAITKDKLFRANHTYEVLGSTIADSPPEYLKITHQFIVDGTIIPSKLVRDFVLYGTPELTVPPSEDADNHQIPDTKWVRKTVANMINNFNPEILFDTVTTEMIANQSITGNKLFTSPYGPRVLGITAPNEEAEYILVGTDYIEDGAVTTNKLQRDIHLLGSPVLDVRPSPYSSDSIGGGDLIPDCQWVIDRIKEYTGNSIPSGSAGSGTVVGDVLNGSISTSKLMDRSVTGEKLFTSIYSNRLLGVLEPNTDPQYIKIINEMFENRVVDGRVLFSSDASDMILAVNNAGTDPVWRKININMLEENIIDTKHIIDKSITNEKVANRTITREKIADEPFVDDILLMDNSVTTLKIVDDAIETSKIKDESITSPKLDNDLVLKGHPTVEVDTSFETRSIRNTIISPNNPTGGCSGDIWFRFI